MTAYEIISIFLKHGEFEAGDWEKDLKFAAKNAMIFQKKGKGTKKFWKIRFCRITR